MHFLEKWIEITENRIEKVENWIEILEKWTSGVDNWTLMLESTPEKGILYYLIYFYEIFFNNIALRWTNNLTYPNWRDLVTEIPKLLDHRSNSIKLSWNIFLDFSFWWSHLVKMYRDPKYIYPYLIIEETLASSLKMRAKKIYNFKWLHILKCCRLTL